jgi:nitrite reductase/ring-hydroxylating ferredoxin subunit
VPLDWTDAAAAADVLEAAPLRVDVDGQQVVLVRRAGTVFAMGAVCSHFGGRWRTARSAVVRRRACLVCPWHRSEFRLADGSVARGPATSPQTSYDVREVGERLQVRVRP